MTAKYLKLILLGLLIVSCEQELVKNHHNLSLAVVPIEGEFLKSNGRTIIQSQSTLLHDDYFVWGGSVINGKDDKYHMLFSLWESGEFF